MRKEVRCIVFTPSCKLILPVLCIIVCIRTDAAVSPRTEIKVNDSKICDKKLYK